jgi:hypothetical protein
MPDSATILSVTGADAVTVLLFDRDKGVARRLWSSMPEVFSASGQKPLTGATWEFASDHLGPALISRGTDELRAHFADHATILAEGINMIVNLPLVVDATCIGSMNCLYHNPATPVDSTALIPAASRWYLDSHLLA